MALLAELNGLSLFSNLRKANKKTDDEETTPIAYPSGFLPLDYMNGQRVKVFDENDDITEEYDSIGWVAGTMIAFISDPGLGKTTLTIQTACNIASQFPQSFVIHEDIEKSSNINRVYSISGMSTKWIKNHYKLFQNCHTEDIWDRFLDHAKTKLNNRKIFEYDTGLKDIYGNTIKSLVPTVHIIDSLAAMRSESISADEDGKNTDTMNAATNNMVGARSAKLNAEFFKQIIPWAKKANIILLVINQISTKINSGFVPQARDLVGLGESQSLSGSRSAMYLANNYVMLKNQGMLKPDKDYGINGNLIKVTLLKSRTNATNNDVTLVYDKATGFSRCLTLLHFAIENNIVKKQGKGYAVPGCENITFTKKNFINEVFSHPELISCLYDACLPKLQEFVTNKRSMADLYENDSEDDEDIDIFELFA